MRTCYKILNKSLFYLRRGYYRWLYLYIGSGELPNRVKPILHNQYLYSNARKGYSCLRHGGGYTVSQKPNRMLLLYPSMLLVAFVTGSLGDNSSHENKTMLLHYQNLLQISKQKVLLLCLLWATITCIRNPKFLLLNNKCYWRLQYLLHRWWEFPWEQDRVTTLLELSSIEKLLKYSSLRRC